MKKKSLAILMAILCLGMSACGNTAQTRQTDVSETMKDNAENAETISSDGNSGGNSATADEAALLEQGLMQTKVDHYEASTYEQLTIEGETMPYAYSIYPEVHLGEASAAKYPELVQTLTDANEDMRYDGMQELATAAGLAEEGEDSWLLTSNYQIANLYVTRADQNLFSYLIMWDSYYNGAHPNSWGESHAYDPTTGEEIPLCDVINGADNMKALPQIILEHLEPATWEEEYVFSEEENAEMLPRIESMVENNYLVWTISDGLLSFYFDAYALQYYAFGPIISDIPLADYPDLVAEQYLPIEETNTIADRTTYGETQKQTYRKDNVIRLYNQNYTEGDGDDAGIYDVPCPSWDEASFTAIDLEETLTAPPYTLTEVAREKYTFADDWAAANGMDTDAVSFYGDQWYYEDDNYNYYVDNSADGGLHVELSQAGTYDDCGTFYFSEYLNYPATAGNEFTPYANMAIRYVKAQDGVLYVQIGHRTYASAQPYTGYIVAVEISSGRCLWRSEMLVANASHFLIENGTIICGYGFTDEKDYMYILSAATGHVLQTIPLTTGPEHFFLEENLLYVLTYDTAYTYQIGK